MRYIYITTNLVNGMSYIGQRKTPKGKTPKQDSYLGSGTRLLYAIKKYNRKNFKKVILHECITQEEADILEIREIEERKALHDKTKFYNISPGGQFGRSEQHSAITSKSMSDYYAIEENYQKWIKRTNKIRKSKGLYELPYKSKKEYDMLKAKEKQIRLLKKNLKAKNRRFRSNINKCIDSFYKNTPESKSYRNIVSRRSAAKANRVQWDRDYDREVNKLANGRRKAAKEILERGDAYWSDDSVKSFSMAKLKQYHNYLQIYLLSKGIEVDWSTYLVIKKLNAAEYSKRYEIDQLNKVVLSVNNISVDMITCDTIKKLINESRNAKNKDIIP